MIVLAKQRAPQSASVSLKIMATLTRKTNNQAVPPALADTAKTGQALILLAEDHDDTRYLYRCVLELRGYRIVEAKDGEEAVRIAQSMLPDLILMDTNLPRVDGLMATNRIRKHSALHNVRIIFVSGNAEPRWRGVALSAGGDEYLVKPVSLDVLEKAVASQLVIRRAKMGFKIANVS
jgi:CheY-like chemotaxis protein